MSEMVQRGFAPSSKWKGYKADCVAPFLPGVSAGPWFGLYFSGFSPQQRGWMHCNVGALPPPHPLLVARKRMTVVEKFDLENLDLGQRTGCDRVCVCVCVGIGWSHLPLSSAHGTSQMFLPHRLFAARVYVLLLRMLAKSACAEFLFQLWASSNTGMCFHSRYNWFLIQQGCSYVLNCRSFQSHWSLHFEASPVLCVCELKLVLFCLSVLLTLSPCDGCCHVVCVFLSKWIFWAPLSFSTYLLLVLILPHLVLSLVCGMMYWPRQIAILEQTVPTNLLVLLMLFTPLSV